MVLLKCIFNFQTDVDMENSLHIKVRDTKNIKLPFNMEIQENIFPEVRKDIRHFFLSNRVPFPFQYPDYEPDAVSKRPTSRPIIEEENGTLHPPVVSSGVDLWIILGGLAAVIMFSIMFLCSHNCVLTRHNCAPHHTLRPLLLCQKQGKEKSRGTGGKRLIQTLTGKTFIFLKGRH